MTQVYQYDDWSEPGGLSRADQELAQFNLTTEILHLGVARGLRNARNRTAAALPSAKGSDIYQDSMEDLTALLKPKGWRLLQFHMQPRLVHPNGVMSFTVSAAKGLSSRSGDGPITNAKGRSTRMSLSSKPYAQDALFEAEENESDPVFDEIPFFFLLHEYTPAGLYLELSSPAAMDDKTGVVTEWSQRIPIPFLSATGDLSPFATDGPDDDFDVPVEPL
ncbi:MULTISPECIES: hypothetical protein [Bifidobacterium]|uniref:Uncharacterized protein n=1 Tax=Bifidobacterium tibiigranuli TaxID=2172043 RepID=A0A5N6S2N0_9BIFI|nr:hypothetical protein [Bifidobacterium tibiigranuli]KAE8127445.1 hypothetical protein DDE84_08125 [Bifidobacterium tibiigranuli]KAE8127890.1 hypothetical protein DDF78_07110 [Bifidobacterium tibiigranuli]